MRNLFLFSVILIFCFTSVDLSLAQWVQSDGPYGGNVRAIAIGPDGSKIFAGTQGAGVFLSTNNGSSWTYSGLTNVGVSALAVSPDGKNIFAGCSTWANGVRLSRDNGSNWVNVSNGLSGSDVSSLAISPDGSRILAGTSNGVFVSTNNGSGWLAINNGLSNRDIWSLAIAPDGSKIFAGTLGGGVYRSTDNGSTWTSANNGLPPGYVYVASLASSPDSTSIFAAVASETSTYHGSLNNARVFRSTDQGSNWTQCDTSLFVSNTVAFLTTSPDGTKLIAGTASGLFLSANNGSSWSPINNGFTSVGSGVPPSVWTIAVGPNDDYILVGTQGQGVYRSSNGGSEWTPANAGIKNVSIRCFTFCTDDSSVLAGSGEGQGIFLSADNGLSWILADSGLKTNDITSFVVSPKNGNIFAAGWGWSAGAYVTSNNGANWTWCNNGLTQINVYSLAISPDGANIFAGTQKNGIFISTDDGASSSAVDSGQIDDPVYSLVISPDGTKLFAGTNGGGVFLSTNNGLSWTAVNSGLSDQCIYSLAISPDGAKVFAGACGDTGGVYLSTNSGLSWARADYGIPNPYISFNSLAITPDGRCIFAGTGFSGAYLSTDDGSSWTSVSEGLPNILITSVAVNRSGTYLFIGSAGGSSIGLVPASQNTIGVSSASAMKMTETVAGGNAAYGVWRRPLSEMITGIESKPARAPACFALEQNYPNPFNPSTVISYQTPTNAFVVLKVYDVLGREIKTLVDERQGAGNHSATFNAMNLPSGVYFYRLEAGPYRDSKKLLLLK